MMIVFPPPRPQIPVLRLGVLVRFPNTRGPVRLRAPWNVRRRRYTVCAAVCLTLALVACGSKPHRPLARGSSGHGRESSLRLHAGRLFPGVQDI